MKIPGNVIPFRLYHAIYVAERLRDSEKMQYEALNGEFQVDLVAIYAGTRNGPKFTLIDGGTGEPVICGGYHNHAPGVWESWMIGTDTGWKKHWISATRAARWLTDAMREEGAQRLFSICHEDRETAIAWHQKSIGMEVEQDLGNGLLVLGWNKGR